MFDNKIKKTSQEKFSTEFAEFPIIMKKALSQSPIYTRVFVNDVMIDYIKNFIYY